MTNLRKTLRISGYSALAALSTGLIILGENTQAQTFKKTTPTINNRTTTPIKSIRVNTKSIKNYTNLQRKLRDKNNQSPIRVIVRLSKSSIVGTPSKKNIKPASFDGLNQTKLSSAQASLISRAKSLGLTGVNKIPSLPLVSLSVNSQGLAKLVARGEVAEVYEDILVPPTLNVSSPLIGAPTLWNSPSGARGQGQTIAVLDTGVQANHPFLRGRIIEEACYSSTFGAAQSVCPGGRSSSTSRGSAQPPATRGFDHGTHVAGIAAGRGNNFSGVAPSARIFAVQVFSRQTDRPGNTFCRDNGSPSPCPAAYTSDILKGLVRVRDRAQSLNISSVNMSLGGGRNTSTCNNDPLRPVIRQLLRAGVATVVSSGNNGFRNAVSSPACIPEAIAVGATDDNDRVTGFSNISRQVRLLAPGQSINSSITGGGFGNKNGTSMAAPHVAGAFALYRSLDPSKSVAQMMKIFRASGQPVRTASLTIPRIDLSNVLGTQYRGIQRLVAVKEYRIKDDEVFSDVFKNYRTQGQIQVRRGGHSTFKPYARKNAPRHCAGGEVRIDDWDRVQVDNNGVARIWVSMQLFEGTSCNNNDLDGKSIGVRSNGSTVGAPFLVVRPGETKSKILRVNNTSEGGDYGRIKYTFTNNR